MTRSNKVLILFALLMTVLCGAAMADPVAVVNGGFESPAISAWTNIPNNSSFVPGWTFCAGDNWLTPQSDTRNGTHLATEGSNGLYSSYAWFYQDILGVANPNTTYTVYFDTLRWTADSFWFNAYVGSAANNYVGGKTFNNTLSVSGTTWTTQSVTFDTDSSVTPGSDLRLWFQDNVQGAVFFDNVRVNASVHGGSPAFQGHIEDVSHNSIVGAKVRVVGGVESTTTDSAGNYTLLLQSSGTYTISASQPGYEPVTYSGLVVGGSAVLQNFTLPTGVNISGNVTQNSGPIYPSLAGAIVTSSDGVYSTATDSAGHYTVRVSRGVYSITFSKIGCFHKTITVDASSGDQTRNVSLDRGYDFAYDYSSASNPTGPWNVGYAWGTAYAQTPDSFVLMNTNSSSGGTDAVWFPTTSDPFWSDWGNNPGYNRPTFAKNMLPYVPNEDVGLFESGYVYREAGKVVTEQSSRAPVYTIARFIAPTSGYYHIVTRFAGSTQMPPYTQSKAAVMAGNNYIFGGPSDVKQIDGFVGRAVNGFVDSAGSSPVFTYSCDRNITTGSKFDALVLNDVMYTRPTIGGWTQVDVTITPDATTLTGHVTASNLPGNPPIAGASVTANGWNTGSTYQTLTDANGYYIMSVKPDTYDMKAKNGRYNDSPNTVVPVAQDAVAVQDFALVHAGTWDLANDFSLQSNPNGQWTYGYVTSTAPGGTLPTGSFVFSPYHSTSVWAMPGWGTGDFWDGWLARNTTGGPYTWNSDGVACYIEPDQMSFGGGGNYNGGGAIRWTAPTNRIVKVAFTIGSQISTSYDAPGTLPAVAGGPEITMFHNGVIGVTKKAQGFVGTSARGYTDSVGPRPTATFQTTLSLDSGDTLDFVQGHIGEEWVHWWPCFGYMWKTMNIGITISPGTGTQVSGISDIYACNQGDTIFMMTPVQLGCGTAVSAGFDKAYGNPTIGSEYWFYIQNPDRTRGIKCITDGSVPSYAPSYKITFTGIVDLEQGQKVVRIQSINSAVAGSDPKPLGKGAKALTNSNTLVRVWGKVTQKVANTGSDNDRWSYDYIVINDGAQDIKIPMHVQSNWMAVDASITSLAVGHYVGITGIAGTTTGTDVVVYPRGSYDISDYTANN